ncbi:MAG: glycosyltransferase 87 family protein [Chloroflexota bacterium]
MKSSLPLSLDTILLLVLVPAHMELNGVSFLLVIPLFFYVVLDLIHSLQQYEVLPKQFRNGRLFFLLRLFLMYLIIAAAVIVPTLANIGSRLTTPVDASGFSPAYADIHDGAIQMEAALDYWMAGKNPYVERYDETPLQYYGFSGLDMPTNPAYEHFVYLPGFLLVSLPFHQFFQQIGFPFDQRWVYLIAYFALMLLLPSFTKQPVLKLTLLAGIVLNPLITGPVIIGMNDILVLLFVVLALSFLQRGKTAVSIIMFGFACTLKQSAWFIAPFYLLLLFQQFPPQGRLKRFAQTAVLLGGTMLVIILPFFLWDPTHFITDVIVYPSGGVDVNYPIRGYTIGNILVGSGFIGSPLDPFPFWILQLVVGVPLLLLLGRYQWRQATMGAMLLSSGIFIFSIGLVSRFFQDNYVGFVVALVLFGTFLKLQANENSDAIIARDAH